MKFRRRTVLVSVGLLLLAIATLTLPAVHWRAIGWYRGEAFFQGRPTSWWAQQVQREDMYLPPVLNYIVTGWRPAAPPQPWWRHWAAAPTSSFPASDALLSGVDPDALPVLLELLGNESPKVRLLAVYGLKPWETAVPALTQAARGDPDEEVRRVAGHTVWQQDPAARSWPSTATKSR
jgi:hypothetical protein